MHLFCPSSSAWQSEGFVRWLSSQHKTYNTIRETVIYAKKYGSILDTGDASLLLTLSDRNRHHILCSVANLAKYQGRYDQFLQLKQRYNLKWTSGYNSSLQSLQRFFSSDLTLDVMLQRIKEMMRLLPTSMSKIVHWGTLVGLCSAEIVESVRLINDKEAFAKYYDPEQQALLHYKFPQFLRTTKKAYISFVTPEMLEFAQNSDFRKSNKVPSYNAIRLTCQRLGITCDMRFGRKIHATHLHQSGVPVEIIDDLQGRTPVSIFAKHYYRPSSDYKVKVLEALEKLQKQLLLL